MIRWIKIPVFLVCLAPLGLLAWFDYHSVSHPGREANQVPRLFHQLGALVGRHHAADGNSPRLSGRNGNQDLAAIKRTSKASCKRSTVCSTSSISCGRGSAGTAAHQTLWLLVEMDCATSSGGAAWRGRMVSNSSAYSLQADSGFDIGGAIKLQQ